MLRVRVEGRGRRRGRDFLLRRRRGAGLIRPAPSAWSCPIRPGAASTPWRASWPRSSAALGQQVVVDNRAGGSGLVGTRAVIKSAPDGYTLFLGHTGSISINPSLYANAGFDPRKDFAPIGLIASMPVALLAHPSFPAKTIGDVVAHRQEGRRASSTSARRRSAPAAISPPSCSSRSPASTPPSFPTRAPARS